MGLSGHIQSSLPVYHTHPGAPPVPPSSGLASPAPLVSTALLLSLPSWEQGLYRGSVLPVAPPAALVLALCHSPTLMPMSSAPGLLYQFGVNLADFPAASCGCIMTGSCLEGGYSSSPSPPPSGDPCVGSSEHPSLQGAGLCRASAQGS